MPQNCIANALIQLQPLIRPTRLLWLGMEKTNTATVLFLCQILLAPSLLLLMILRSIPANALYNRPSLLDKFHWGLTRPLPSVNARSELLPTQLGKRIWYSLLRKRLVNVQETYN